LVSFLGPPHCDIYIVAIFCIAVYMYSIQYDLNMFCVLNMMCNKFLRNLNIIFISVCVWCGMVWCVCVCV
jgi:hypothetical protein